MANYLCASCHGNEQLKYKPLTLQRQNMLYFPAPTNSLTRISPFPYNYPVIAEHARVPAVLSNEHIPTHYPQLLGLVPNSKCIANLCRVNIASNQNGLALVFSICFE